MEGSPRGVAAGEKEMMMRGRLAVSHGARRGAGSGPIERPNAAAALRACCSTQRIKQSGGSPPLARD